jgi:hypothetical protein
MHPHSLLDKRSLLDKSLQSTLLPGRRSALTDSVCYINVSFYYVLSELLGPLHPVPVAGMGSGSQRNGERYFGLQTKGTAKARR